MIANFKTVFIIIVVEFELIAFKELLQTEMLTYDGDKINDPFVYAYRNKCKHAVQIT
jgi:hypothetical protein